MGNGEQLGFGFRTPPRRRRPRRGRRPTGTAGVRHQPRQVHGRQPLLITLRVHRHVWQLRSRRCFVRIERAFGRMIGRFDARVAHFSVQRDHIHLLVEAPDRARLARAMQSFTISTAKQLNKLMNRRGAVFADRFHSRALRTPTEVRAALVYVLNNFHKHHRYGQLGPQFVDPFSSAAAFDGWSEPVPSPPSPPPVSRACSWLLEGGWRRAGGLVRRDEKPRATED